MDNIEKISLQKIFNLAWEHFIVRDEPPAVYNGACMYLTRDGRKCAVGLALPEGHMMQNLRVPFGTMVEMYPEMFDEDVRSTSARNLSLFQFRLHDHMAFRGGVTEVAWVRTLDERKEAYLAVAKDYGLTVPEDSAAR